MQEAEIKPVNETGEIVLSKVVIPAYATWPDDSIRVNVLAIMFFTLNCVYTE